MTWLIISFFGFLIGITTLDITLFIIPCLFFFISTFFILSFTFAVNNYYDIDTDKENPRRAHLNSIASGLISKSTSALLLLIFILIPLSLSLYMTPWYFVFCSFLLFWMWIYSAPPLRFKGRPVVDILWHFIAFFALILWGSYLGGSISLLQILIGISFGLFGCFAQIDNHIRDYQYDKASGLQTFVVWIGIQHASVALKISFMLYLGFLLPLIILFSVYSYLSVLIIVSGFLISLLFIQIKKGSIVSSLYHIINYFGGSVYLSCLVYHISSIL